MMMIFVIYVLVIYVLVMYWLCIGYVLVMYWLCIYSKLQALSVSRGSSDNTSMSIFASLMPGAS